MTVSPRNLPDRQDCGPERRRRDATAQIPWLRLHVKIWPTSTEYRSLQQSVARLLHAIAGSYWTSTKRTFPFTEAAISAGALHINRARGSLDIGLVRSTPQMILLHILCIFSEEDTCPPSTQNSEPPRPCDALAKLGRQRKFAGSSVQSWV